MPANAESVGGFLPVSQSSLSAGLRTSRSSAVYALQEEHQTDVLTPLILTELGNTAPKEPFFFLKPTTSYLANNGIVELPQGIDVHHEVELGVVIGKKGRDVSEGDAMKYIAGYTLAIDMCAI